MASADGKAGYKNYLKNEGELWDFDLIQAAMMIGPQAAILERERIQWGWQDLHYQGENLSDLNQFKEVYKLSDLVKFLSRYPGDTR